ncbi:PREDICTED: neutrophil gelatinase-associated lipocalin-like [Chinchilla lanigera]|uniref:neutrophil gelatinase-associated lipocalin-like n=1 Tax=Chinchilla lanigera TaxID=34839 RepID=UPI0006966221|nr:PREDICTED: neutrophil gelatinase-associated lipocalin-like [Chinchilla lanigera]
MAPGLLCLGLILMGAWQTQAKDSTLEMTQSSVLSEVPRQPDFQDKKFQGKWFTIGGAENTVQREGKPAMHRITYKLEANHSFSVVSTWLRKQDCEHWGNTVVPSGQPSQFTMVDNTSLSEIQNFTMIVVATDYKQFAIVFFKVIIKDRVQLVVTLLGRTMVLSPELKERFVKIAMTLGFADKNIFFLDPMGNYELGRGDGNAGSVRTDAAPPGKECRRPSASWPSHWRNGDS